MKKLDLIDKKINKIDFKTLLNFYFKLIVALIQ